MIIDILVDLQFGDCGKGKISKWLLEQRNYWAVAKYNGGPNAGHAVWIGDDKYTSHMLTSAIYHPTAKIIIGPGCVLNVDKFLQELEDFKEFKVEDRVLVHPNTHIICSAHIEQDSKDNIIGTTKQGVGPTYADKMLRVGTRANQIAELKPYLLDPESLYRSSKASILMEGSQGWWLDIDNGFYPYVTSSNIHPAHALSTFGFPPQNLGTIYGVAKVYETYVGENKTLVQSLEEDANLIREVGKEYGETTGRPRQVGYLNLPRLIKAVNSTGVSFLILNKLDILEEVGIFKLFRYNTDMPEIFNNVTDFKKTIRRELLVHCPYLKTIEFSGNKETV